MEKPSSVVVPCGTQDLSILTITPSFSQGSHSSTDQLPDSSQTDSVVEGTHDGMTTTTNTTETSEGNIDIFKLTGTCILKLESNYHD